MQVIELEADGYSNPQFPRRDRDKNPREYAAGLLQSRPDHPYTTRNGTRNTARPSISDQAWPSGTGDFTSGPAGRAPRRLEQDAGSIEGVWPTTNVKKWPDRGGRNFEFPSEEQHLTRATSTRRRVGRWDRRQIRLMGLDFFISEEGAQDPPCVIPAARDSGNSWCPS